MTKQSSSTRQSCHVQLSRPGLQTALGRVVVVRSSSLSRDVLQSAGLSWVKTDHPFPNSLTPLLQIVLIVFRTEPLQVLQREDEDLLTILNPLVKGSLSKTEAVFLFSFVLLPTVYIYCFLCDSNRPKNKLTGKKRTLSNEFSVGWKKYSFQNEPERMERQPSFLKDEAKSKRPS